MLLDTPYGFQENAAEVSQRAVEYFAQRVQLAIEVAGFPARSPPIPASAPISPRPRRSRGSARPTSCSPGRGARRMRSTWQGSSVPEAISDKLAHGGVAIFASAAAVTVGRFSLPVYEIYKVGHPIHWLDGLDLLSPLGFGAHCVVVPHFDNAEGGTHDTRFCYMGERRLAVMEELLPLDAWVLGVDEHTALVFDLDAGDATVTGRGVVTVRRRGVAERFPAGTRMPMTSLVAAARGARESGGAAATPPTRCAIPPRATNRARSASALSTRSRGSSRRSWRRLPRGGRGGRGGDPRPRPDDPRLVGGHAANRRARPRTGGAPLAGASAGRSRLGRPARSEGAPGALVEGLIVLRAELRTEKAWQVADRLRDRLVAGGIELHDTPGARPGRLATDGPRAAAGRAAMDTRVGVQPSTERVVIPSGPMRALVLSSRLTRPPARGLSGVGARAGRALLRPA